VKTTLDARLAVEGIILDPVKAAVDQRELLLVHALQLYVEFPAIQASVERHLIRRHAAYRESRFPIFVDALATLQCHGDSKSPAKLAHARLRDAQRTSFWPSRDPSQSQQTRAERCTEGPRQVRPSLRPVQTLSRERTAATPQRFDIHT
jgi:hypothetical protein